MTGKDCDNILKNFGNVTTEYLENFHTKQLLEIQRHSRIITKLHHPPKDEEGENKWYAEREVFQALLKQVLSTREHVKNKKELKEIRKEKAKNKS